MLSEQRRLRLVFAMAHVGIEEFVLYGNAWQGDYLRYAADFGILEGHGIAIVAAEPRYGELVYGFILLATLLFLPRGLVGLVARLETLRPAKPIVKPPAKEPVYGAS